MTVTTRLSGMIVLTAVLAVTTPAQAQTAPSAKFPRWVCVIDFKQALGAAFAASGLPNEIRTTNTEKHCTGSLPNNTENTKINCTAQLPGSSFSGNYSGFPCQIFRGQCGSPGFAPVTTNSNLDIGGGVATLTCNFNGSTKD